MKKLIASLLVLVLGASMVMAEIPAPGAKTPPAVTVSPADFADVEGQPLSSSDCDTIAGAGVTGVVAGIIVGYMAGVVGYGLGCAVEIITTGHSNPSLAGMITSVSTSMVSGAMFGLFSPLP